MSPSCPINASQQRGLPALGWYPNEPNEQQSCDASPWNANQPAAQSCPVGQPGADGGVDQRNKLGVFKSLAKKLSSTFEFLSALVNKPNVERSSEDDDNCPACSIDLYQEEVNTTPARNLVNNSCPMEMTTPVNQMQAQSQTPAQSPCSRQSNNISTCPRRIEMSSCARNSMQNQSQALAQSPCDSRPTNQSICSSPIQNQSQQLSPAMAQCTTGSLPMEMTQCRASMIQNQSQQFSSPTMGQCPMGGISMEMAASGGVGTMLNQSQSPRQYSPCALNMSAPVLGQCPNQSLAQSQHSRSARSSSRRSKRRPPPSV